MSRKKKLIILILFIFVILWCVGIYILSDMNTTDSNGNSLNFISIFIEDTLKLTNEYDITSSNPTQEKLIRASILLNKPLRKAAHASVYFVLGFMIILILNMMMNNKRYFISLFITLCITITLALLDEYHQTMVDGRTGALLDVIIDNIGALVGCLFYTTYYIAYLIGKRSGNKKIKDKIDV